MYRHCVRVVLFFVTIPVICVSMYVEGDRGTGSCFVLSNLVSVKNSHGKHLLACPPLISRPIYCDVYRVN